jgi:hypothetical protein
MRFASRLLALFISLASVWLLAGPATADKDDPQQIDKLIEQLGSGSFQEREAATKALDAIGAPALEKLRKAAESDDIEVSRRASDLVKRIEKRADVSRVLTPKRVHLVSKDTPLKEALEDFKKKSGYEITLYDPDSKLINRRVTLDTGEVPFWEAFDQFCDKTDLAPATPQDMRVLMMQQMREQQQRMIEIERQRAALPQPAGVPPAKEKKESTAEKKEESKPAAKKEEGAKAAPPAAPPFGPVAPAPVDVRARFGVGSVMGQNQLVLMEGKGKRLPTHYAGAVCIRAKSLEEAPGAPNGPLNVSLQVAAEPKLQVRSIVSTRVDKALDDNGQSLAQQTAGADEDLPRGPVVAPPVARAIPAGAVRYPMMMGGPGLTVVQFKKGEKPSKTLAELKGTITVQVIDESRMMFTTDDILKSSGAKLRNKDSASLTVVEASKTDAGQIVVQVELELPPDVMPARNPGVAGAAIASGVRINAAVPVAAPPPAPAADKPKETPAKGEKDKAKEDAQTKLGTRPAAARVPAFTDMGVRYPGNMFSGLRLLDEKGKSLPINRVTASSQVAAGGKNETKYEITFEATKDENGPFKLTFSGSRIVTLDLPFTLKDVPLK